MYLTSKKPYSYLGAYDCIELGLIRNLLCSSCHSYDEWYTRVVGDTIDPATIPSRVIGSEMLIRCVRSQRPAESRVRTECRRLVMHELEAIQIT